MRSLESRVRANLKCHFGGLALVVPEVEVVRAKEAASKTNPKAGDFDVEAARSASYRAMADVAYDKYGTGASNRVGEKESSKIPSETADALVMARQKIFETLKASPEIAEVSDLYPDDRFRGSVAYGAFAPIFFVYKPPAKIQTREEEKEAQPRRFYFVYNGRFIIVTAFCQPDEEVPALSETVSEVCLLLSKTGYEFHRLSPVPTLQSLDLGGVSAGSPAMAAVLNDSVGGAGTATALFMSKPKTIQNSLRSLFAVLFQPLMKFYSLREESDTGEAIFQTIEAHREAVLDLMHEFNQTKGRQFLKRRRLRKRIRTHCFNLTEKIGRVDAISDSLSQGIISLESNLREEPYLRAMLEREPSWKSYLHNEYDTEPVLDMVTRVSGEINRTDTGLIVFVVALLAAAAGALVGSFVSKII